VLASRDRPERADTEVEWQFDALDLRPVERWAIEHTSAGDEVAAGANGVATCLSLAPRPTRQLLDRYVDTADWRIGRSGHVLRLRQRGGSLEATLKDLSPARAGLRRRVEVTETALGTGLAALAALDPAGPVGRRVRSLTGSHKLAEILEVRTRRRPYVVMIDGEPAGELALDDTTIRSPGDQRTLRLQRVEVEVTQGEVRSVRPVVQQLSRDCGLSPATLSKFEAGLLAAGIAIPALPDLGSTEVTREATTGEVAYAVLRRDTLALLAHEPGTRLGEDIEALHQMRVSTRRMRAAIDLFQGALPARAAHFRSELGWLADALGAVRDLDIQLSHFDSWMAAATQADREGLGRVVELLSERRDAARTALLEVLDSRRYERLVSGLSGMLRAGPLRRSAIGRQLAVVSTAPWIGARHEAALKAARRARRTGVATDFHRLRIRCKRLRYSLDFTNELYGHELRSFGKLLGQLQDELGLMQDAEVAAQHLRELAAEPEAASLPPSAIFVMGALAERYRDECEQRLRGLRAHLKWLNGQRARKAFAAIERQRARGVAAMAPPGRPPSRPRPPAADPPAADPPAPAPPDAAVAAADDLTQVPEHQNGTARPLEPERAPVTVGVEPQPGSPAEVPGGGVSP